jgi:uncharacterized protein (UPF0332 family)
VDPLQFLTLAEWLLKDHRHPAGTRSAISRAYYASHHVACQFVESAGIVVSKSNDRHLDVVRHLEQSSDEIIEKIASDLTVLRSARNDADYQLNQMRVQNELTAAFIVERAKDLIARIQDCRNDPARNEKVKIAIRIRHRVLRGLTPS